MKPEEDIEIITDFIMRNRLMETYDEVHHLERLLKEAKERFNSIGFIKELSKRSNPEEVTVMSILLSIPSSTIIKSGILTNFIGKEILAVCSSDNLVNIQSESEMKTNKKINLN